MQERRSPPSTFPSLALLCAIRKHYTMSLPDSLARVEEDIARTEEEIYQRTVFLANLHAKKNTFLPVFSLPPEILEAIFIHGARDHYENRDGDGFTRSIPSWVNVSYVCTHWRNIALNYPTLWTYHFNLSRRWSEELLLRSKEASLKISCSWKDRPWSFEEGAWWQGMNNLLMHMQRIQVLRLDLAISHPRLSFRAPRLEILEINFREQPKGCLTVADADTPILQTLKLSRCLLPWSLFNLSRLTTFSICNVCFPSDIEFLAVLGSMQDLTVLHLKHSLSYPFFSGDLDFSPKINLPCLDLLVVSAPLSMVLALLSYVNIPLKARLSIDLGFDYDASADHCAQLCSLLAHRFIMAEQFGAIVRSLMMDTDGYVSLTLSSSERDCRPPLPEELDDDIPLQITFRRVFFETGNTSECFRLMADICSSLPLANVQSLYVCSPEWPSEVWREILGCLDGLRYLKLTNGFMPDLSMLSLTAGEPEESSGREGCVLVPALEEVEIAQVCFSPDDGMAGDGMSQKSLLDVLSTRKGLRDRVTMIMCSVLPSG